MKQRGIEYVTSVTLYIFLHVLADIGRKDKPTAILRPLATRATTQYKKLEMNHQKIH